MRIERDQAIALLALAAIVAVFFGIRLGPGWVRQNRLNARIAAARGELAGDPVASAKLASLAKQVDELRETSERPLREVPKEAELAPLLRRLGAELENRRVSDQELHTDPIVAGGEYSFIPVAVSFRGSFPAAFALLRQVESMPRMVRVTQASFTGDASRPDEPLKARIELCAFFSRSEEGKP